ncbi:MAG: DinB family protein [Acidobacteriota bacterium]
MTSRLLFAAALCLPALFAQEANPLTADAKSFWAGMKANNLKAAEKMPEAEYSFKPTPEVRSYGQLVGHIADGNRLFCSIAKGEAYTPSIEKSKTSKADLVAALKDAIAFCDAVYDSMTDAHATQMVKMFGRDRTKLGALYLNISHDNEHYGNQVTYLRLKGIIPPSSEPQR